MRTTGLRSKGFTLIELVMVIIILGVLAAVGLPRFFDTAVYDERFFYDDLLSTARYAKKFSVATGCKSQLSISSGGFSLLSDANCFTVTPSSYTLAVPDPSSSVNGFSNSSVPDSISLSSYTVVFNPDGTSGSATIILGSRTITIDGAVGYVR